MNARGGPGTADGLPFPRRYGAIAALSLGTMIASIDSGSVNIALPTLARELHVAPSAAVLVVTIYQLVLIMAVLPLSALGDRLGHRTLYQYGQMLFVSATLLCFVADSLPVLVAVRALQALGAAATFSVSSAMIRSTYPNARLGRGMALNTVIAATSASLAPSFGGLILSVARWPWLFAICVPLGLISVFVGRNALPDPVKHDEPYDVAGAVMCAAMFGFGVTGLESIVHGASWQLTAPLLLAAALVGSIFVRREAGQANPVFPVDLLRERQIALSTVASVTASIASMLIMLTLPFRLQMEYGYSPAQAGLILAPWPMVTMIVAPTSGVLSDRLPAGFLGSLGMVIAVCGLASLAYLPATPTHFDLIWRIMLCALGFGLFYPPNARQIIFFAPIKRAAAAGGLTQTTRMTGQVVGSTTAAGLLAIGSGIGSHPSLFAAALAAFAALCSMALLGSKIRRTGA